MCSTTEWVVLKHPAYSPELLLRTMKGGPQIHFALRRAEDFGTLLRQQAREFFVDGLRRLVQRRDYCLNVCGDSL
jgi:hypothetical protein